MINQTLIQYNMIKSGDRVLVAISGGADSVALLHLLSSRRQELGITLEAAHVNHCLRGDESTRDRDFVVDLCDKMGVKLHLLEANIAEIARSSGEGTEECGRRVRYEFFDTIPADKIATAHTKSDLAETVIMNLTRGAGLQGLCGIPPVRGKIIRPLISCTRSEIEKYCAENSLSFVNDSTNFEDIYKRNFVRRNIMPLLSKINPDSENKIYETALLLRQDAEYLNSVAREALKNAASGELFHIQKLKALPAPVLSRAFIIMAGERGITLYQKNIAEMMSALRENSSCVLPGGALFACSGELCGINPERPEIYGEALIIIPSEHNISSGKLIISQISSDEFNKDKKINNLLFKNTLDCDMIRGNPVLRSIRPGDRLNLPERGLSKPLRKLFSESGIPERLRRGIPVIADENGPLWVSGYGTDGRARVGESTKNIMKIQFTRGNF